MKIMETLLKDIRFGIRNLLKHPTFALTALLTLAIGIGANTTIFSFVNGILLRPLPYPDSERLVVINETAPKRGIPSMSISFPNFLDWRAQNHVFEDISSYDSERFSITGRESGATSRRIRISRNFRAIARCSSLGRTFTAEEDRPKTRSRNSGYSLWQSRFAANAQVVARRSSQQSTAHRSWCDAARFKFPEEAELWVLLGSTQLCSRALIMDDFDCATKDGVSLAQAQAEMDVIARRSRTESGDERRPGVLVTVCTSLTGDYRKALLVLLGVVGFVLLVASVNVANLMLARTSARKRSLRFGRNLVRAAGEYPSDTN